MKIETYVKRVKPKPYNELIVRMGGGEYEVDFVVDLLYELENTSPGIVNVLIHDKKLRKSLEKEGIIGTSIRGSSFMASGARLRELRSMLEKKLVKFFDSQEKAK
ncbi:hypothetical protein HYT23_04325 [Candidatus Pacearchaeota archaeon]|nr:hypothetical protein [Candidatus Pacearchaeota archaeon]